MKNLTCYHCAKTDKAVIKRVSVPQSVFGDWIKTTAGYTSKPDQVYWYHPSCFSIVDKLAAIELFGVTQ